MLYNDFIRPRSVFFDDEVTKGETLSTGEQSFMDKNNPDKLFRSMTSAIDSAMNCTNADFFNQIKEVSEKIRVQKDMKMSALILYVEETYPLKNDRRRFINAVMFGSI